MTRGQYLQKVKDIMIYKNPYGAFHQQNFDTYGAYGEMTPINSDIINDMPNSQIVLNEKVYQGLLAVKEATNESGDEFPFLLYGKVVDNNQIEFSEFISSGKNRKHTEADFNQELIDDLQDKINSNLNNDLVICHGHSHPPIGSFHQNFSLGDFISYMQTKEDNPVFKNRQVELIGCLVTSTGDINFVFYDNVNENFYRFTNVVVREKDNSFTPVNCYGLNQSQQLNNGNMRR